MMIPTKDVHKQFAHYFKEKTLQPYLYLLSKGLNEGHICLSLDQIDLDELSAAGFDRKLSHNDLDNAEWVGNENEYLPLILHQNRLYFQRYFQYESMVLNQIKNWVVQGKENRKAMQQQLLAKKEWIQHLFPMEKKGVNWQQIAALSSVLNQFSIITGGPGTGKTTTLAKVLYILYALQPEMKVALAAPTGKAAARMAESLKAAGAQFPEIQSKFESLTPSTLHRLLKPQKNSIYFRHNAENPLPYDLVIVDESSMIDLALFAKLLQATRPSTKIIFLGDKDQLASVEAGSLFGDLCLAQKKLNQFSAATVDFMNAFIPDKNHQLGPEHTTESNHLLFEHIVELQVSHRFSDEEGIGKLSKAILQNQTELLEGFFDNQEERVKMDEENTSKVFEEFIEGFRTYIEEKDTALALRKLNDLKVLCAIREGQFGLYALNDRIQKYLQTKGWLQLTTEFYENRPIIINQNNYELGLFNGDIGLVRKDENGVLKVWFESKENELKSVLPALIDAADTVFAMTIHKSQGSEFNEVLVVLPEQENLPLLTRELLYTAVTRARERVILQGAKNVVLSSAKKRVERGSGIVHRF